MAEKKRNPFKHPKKPTYPKSVTVKSVAAYEARIKAWEKKCKEKDNAKSALENAKKKATKLRDGLSGKK